MSLDAVLNKLFGDKAKDVKQWCVKREKPDPYNAIPKGRVANVFVILEAVSKLIIRQEQETTDVTVIPSQHGFNLPAILNPKFQSGAVRRQLLAMLHEWFDRKGAEYVKILKEYGYSSDRYTCVMRPYMKRGEAEKKRIPEGFEGYCGECPNCLIFGYAVQEGAGYNVKSRVEGDLYVASVPSEKVISTTTFIAVDDIGKTTYRPEAPETQRTGALYQFTLIEPGTLFVGKIAVKDVTCAELLLVLTALARTTRVGGRVTHFGEIKVHIPAILFSKFEIGSGYEIANSIVGKHGGEKVSLETVLNELGQYVTKFENLGTLVQDRGLADKLRALTEQETDAIILEAWKDTLVYKKSLDFFVGKGSEKK